MTDPMNALLSRAFTAIAQIVAGVIKGTGVSAKALAAADALTVIGAIVDTVKEGLEGGKLSPEEAHEALDRLIRKIGENDLAADAAIARRFGKE